MTRPIGQVGASAEPQALRITLDFTRAEDAGDPFAFRVGRQRYILRDLTGATQESLLDWDAPLLGDLQALRRPGCDPAVIQRVGERLRGFVEGAGWERSAAALRRALDAGQRVNIDVRSAAAELYALPWELLVVDARGQCVGELDDALLRYAWPGTTSAEELLPREEAGRILFAWSAAGGPVPALEHRRALADAARAGGLDFDEARDVLAQASLAAIRDALAEGVQDGRPFRALHLLCHGGATGSAPGLWLDGDAHDAPPALLAANHLRAALAPHAGHLRLVVLAACESGGDGALGNQLGGLAQGLHRAGIAAVVASRFPLSVDGSIALTEALYRGLAVELRSLEGAFRASRARLLQRPDALDWASLQLYSRPEDGDDSRPLVLRPYRGLLSFGPEHERFFFGREAEIEELRAELAALAELGRPRLMIVAGSSGTGKSSVVRCGAGPRWLRDADRPDLLSMRPGSAPNDALAALLAERDPSRPCVLVVDQFEELFTHVDAPAERERFARRLWALASDPAGALRIVLVLRVDFIGECGGLVLDDAGLRLDRVAYAKEHQVLVAQMDEERLREAIVRPAAAVGLSFEPGLVARVLADLGAEPGGLPLLQDTLDLLWQRRRGAVLTQAAYVELGGITGALHGRADRLIDGLDLPSQRAARRLLVRLVSVDVDSGRDARRRAEVARLRPSADEDAARFDAVLGRLVAARLLVRDEERGTPTVEVAHEALLRKWPRLRRWLAEDRDKLSELAKLERWVRESREHGEILAGAQLAYAVDVAARHPDDIDPAMRETLAASQAEALRRQRARQRLTIGSVVAALVFAALALVAGGLWSEATAMEQRARSSERDAQAREEEARASESVALREARAARDSNRLVASETADDLALKLGFLRELEVDATAATHDTWRSGVLAAIRQPLRRAALEHPAAVADAAISGDGSRVATCVEGGAFRVWDVDDARPQARVVGEPGRGRCAVALDRGGDRLVLGSEAGARVVDLATGAASTLDLDAAITAVALSRDGASIATGTVDGRVRRWRGRAPHRLIDEVTVATAAIDELLFDAASERLAVVGSVREQAFMGAYTRVTAWIFDLHKGMSSDRVDELRASGSVLRGAAFVEDHLALVAAQEPRGGGPLVEGPLPGDLVEESFSPVLAVAASGERVRTLDDRIDGALVVRDHASGRRLGLLGNLGAGTELAMSEADRRLVTWAGAKPEEVAVWDFIPAARPATFLLGGEAWVLAFSPDERWLVAGGPTAGARAWGLTEPIEVELVQPGEAALALAFDPTSERLAIGRVGRVEIWGAAEGLRHLHDLEIAEKRALTSTGFAADGALVACATEGSAWRWEHTRVEAQPAAVIGDWPAHTAGCGAHGEVIARERGPGLRVWDATGRASDLVPSSTEHDIDADEPSTPEAVAPEAANVEAKAGESSDAAANRLAPVDDEPAPSSADDHRWPRPYAFSRDGQVIFESLIGGGALWRGGERAASLPERDLWDATLDPDPSRLLTVAYFVELWDTADLSDSLFRLPAQDDIYRAARSPTDRWIATASAAGEITLWPHWRGAGPAELRGLWRTLWRITPRCPSPAERARMMGVDRAQAEAEHARCAAMVTCAAGASDARLDACRAELRRAQESRAPFDATRVKEGEPRDSESADKP